MRIVITGISGFVGTALAKALVARGHRVTGMVRAHSRTAHLRDLDLTIQTASFGEPALLAQILAGHDVVIHAAAKVHNIGRWPDFVAATIAGTQAVLEAACVAGVPRFLQISTVGVYGFPPQTGAPSVAETDPPRPIHRWNYYSRSKAAAENLVRAAAAAGRISATILRPSWIYGPEDATILGRILSALQQRRYRWIGDGSNRLSMVFLSDAVAAIVAATESTAARNQTYNISADHLSPTQTGLISKLCELKTLPLPDKRLSYRRAYLLAFLAECLSHATGQRVSPPLTRLSVLLLGGHRRFLCHKATEELGWTPQVNFDEGICRALGENRPT